MRATVVIVNKDNHTYHCGLCGDIMDYIYHAWWKCRWCGGWFSV